MMTLMEQHKKRMSELGNAKGIIILESETIQGLINEFDALVDEIDGNKPKENPNMTNERLLALFDHYGIDSRDALIEHLHEQLTHMRIVHQIKDLQIEADRQAKERYEHLLRTTTEERELDFRDNGFCLCVLTLA